MTTPLLDKSHKKVVDRNLIILHNLMGALTQLEACGQSCDEFRAVSLELWDQLQAINKHIFGVDNTPPKG